MPPIPSRYSPFQNSTGKRFDEQCQALGLRTHRIRKGNIEITPRPLISEDGVQAVSDVSSELYTPELAQQFSASIPEETLVKCFGTLTAARSALALNQSWEIYAPRLGWLDVRVISIDDGNDGQRIGVKFASLGLGELAP
jgi:hypothetical protein